MGTPLVRGVSLPFALAAGAVEIRVNEFLGPNMMAQSPWAPNIVYVGVMFPYRLWRYFQRQQRGSLWRRRGRVRKTFTARRP